MVSPSGAPLPAAPPSHSEEWELPRQTSAAGRIPIKPRSPFRSPELKEAALDAMQACQLSTHGQDLQSCTGASAIDATSTSYVSCPQVPESPLVRKTPEPRPKSPSPVTAAVAHASLHTGSPYIAPPLPGAALATQIPSGHSLISTPKLGPPPADDDTEAFLRYLDKFQQHAEHLCVIPSVIAGKPC